MKKKWELILGAIVLFTLGALVFFLIAIWAEHGGHTPIYGSVLAIAVFLSWAGWAYVTRRRVARTDPGASFTPSVPDDKDTDALYRVAKALDAFVGRSAHPADLRRNRTFDKGVALLRSEAYGPTDLAGYFNGDNTVIACLAAEALRLRPNGREASDRIIDVLDSVGEWPFYFGLQFLSEAVPADEPIIGRVLARISDELTYGRYRTFAQEFVRDRLAAGERPVLGGAFDGLSQENIDDIKEFIDALDMDGVPLATAFLEWRNGRIDREFLASVGDLWTSEHFAEANELIEHDVLRRAVDQLEAGFDSPNRHSVLMVGERGSGKTAIVHRLAARLGQKGWTIFEAGHAELIAGHTYIGEFEESLRDLIDRLGGNRRILWLIPGFHMLAFSGRHQYSPISALDMLLPLVERGEIIILGETEPEAYEQLVRSMPRVQRALQVLQAPEMKAAQIAELAAAWLDRWTTVDGDSAQLVQETANLADQYLGDMAAPGNVLSLLERARDQLTAGDPAARPHIAVNDLVTALSAFTGLPRSLLDHRQDLDLDALRDLFKRRVMGQDEAIECLVERIAMMKAGVSDPTRPAGVFLFAGPTGTGKTEIAKTLAEWLFGSANRLLRIDMSELQSPESLDRVLGSEMAGDGTSLVSRIRTQPFAVVLLDEFEKAAAPVWDVFLQLFDDGRLTDSDGFTADFRQSIIILTSNLGSAIPTGTPLGFGTGPADFDADSVMQEIQRTFRREFVNRIDRVVVFRPLSRDLMRSILDKELADALQRRGLRTRSWAIEWDEASIEFLLEKGVTPDLGARPLKRAIERYFLSPLAVTIVNHQVPEGDQFLFVSRSEDGLDVTFVDPDAPTVDAETREVPDADSAVPEDQANTLKSIALDARGSASELEFLRGRYDRISSLLESESWQADKRAAYSIMEESGFWNSRERFDVLDQVEYQDRIEAAFKSARSLMRRLDGATRRVRTRYPDRLVRLLGHNLYLLETACTDLEQGRAHDAFLLVEAGREAGLPEGSPSAEFARDIGRMYRKWAERRRMRLRVIDEDIADEAGGYRLLLSVSGFGAYAILAAEAGLHVLETPTGRSGRFERSWAHVRVAPQNREPAAQSKVELREQAAAALDDQPAGEPKVTRRYRNDPSPLVRDNVQGWRTGRLDTVLNGDFDLMERR